LNYVQQLNILFADAAQKTLLFLNVAVLVDQEVQRLAMEMVGEEPKAAIAQSHILLRNSSKRMDKRELK
jgi:hypothetical protein